MEAVGPEVFDLAPVAIVLTSGPGHDLVYANAEHRRTFGAHNLGGPLRAEAHAADADAFSALLDRVYTTGEPEQITIGLGDDCFTWSCSPVTAHRGGRGLLLMALDVTAQSRTSREARELAEERRRVLRRYQALVETVTPMVWLVGPDGSAIEPVAGWHETTGQTWPEGRGLGWLDQVHPHDRGAMRTAFAAALRECPDVFEYPFRLRTADGTYRHVVARAVPIRVDGKVVEWIGATADVEDQWQSGRRERLLSRAAAATDALRLEDALDALANVIVPELADACGVYLLPGTGERLEPPTVAIRIAATARPGLPPLPPLEQTRYMVQEPLAGMLSRRRSLLVQLDPDGPPRPGVPPEIHQWLVAVRATSLALLPVVVDGTLAAMASVVTCNGAPPLTSENLILLREVLEHAHVPLSHALHFQRTHHVARTLQQALLTDPPDVPGVELAVRYHPSAMAAEIGGDWYDAFRLPDGALALTIGDVVGHDVTAASAMGQLRSMLRALAYENATNPARTLTRLDNAATGLGVTGLATVVHARLERSADGGWDAVWSNAGHPPPLLLHPDGSHERLEAADGTDGPQADLPLCVDPEGIRTGHRVRVPPGSTLLLYTDGLIEAPGTHLDDGIRDLAAHAAAARHLDAGALCDRLIAEAPDARDDIAVVAFRP